MLFFNQMAPMVAGGGRHPGWLTPRQDRERIMLRCSGGAEAHTMPIGEFGGAPATPGGNNARAEGCFPEALRVSESQGTLFWELRASIGLARLR